jgi:hypothetical protein
MDAVPAHLNFKLSALIIDLSKLMKNVSDQQVVPFEMYSTSFQTR